LYPQHLLLENPNQGPAIATHQQRKPDSEEQQETEESVAQRVLANDVGNPQLAMPGHTVAALAPGGAILFDGRTWSVSHHAVVV